MEQNIQSFQCAHVIVPLLFPLLLELIILLSSKYIVSDQVSICVSQSEKPISPEDTIDDVYGQVGFQKLFPHDVNKIHRITITEVQGQGNDLTNEHQSQASYPLDRQYFFHSGCNAQEKGENVDDQAAQTYEQVKYSDCDEAPCKRMCPVKAQEQKDPSNIPRTIGIPLSSFKWSLENYSPHQQANKPLKPSKSVNYLVICTTIRLSDACKAHNESDSRHDSIGSENNKEEGSIEVIPASDDDNGQKVQDQQDVRDGEADGMEGL